MFVPNTGPERLQPSDGHAPDHARRGNPSLVYRDDVPTDELAAASTRASTITQRFGGVRYALSRPGAPFTSEAPAFDSFEPGTSDEPRPLFDVRLGWPWQARLDLPTEGTDGGESDPRD